MSFRQVTAAPKRAAARGLGCSIGKHGFMISCAAASLDESGLSLRERYSLFLGEGEDAGRARIVRADQRGGRMLSQAGSGGARIQFGIIRELEGIDIHPCERVLWKRIDKDTLEIELPSWGQRSVAAKASPEKSVPPAKPPAPSIAAKPKPASPSKAQVVKGLTIDFAFEEETIAFRDKVMDVTANEAALALRLANGAPSAVARNFLVQRVYAGHRNDDANVLLDRDAKGLSKALEGIGLKLNTVKGIGFSIGGLV